MKTAELIQVAALVLGVALLVTLPIDDLPPISWRIHFGSAQMLFGFVFGFGARRWFADRLI